MPCTCRKTQEGWDHVQQRCSRAAQVLCAMSELSECVRETFRQDQTGHLAHGMLQQLKDTDRLFSCIEATWLGLDHHHLQGVLASKESEK